MTSGRGVSWGLGLVAALAVSVALADAVPVRTFGVHWRGRTPAVSFSASDLLGAEGARKLQSGLPQRIVMRLYAYGAGDRPVAVVARSCRVVYDLWDEAYRVEVQSTTGQGSFTARSLADVEARCLVANALALGTDADWAQVSGEAYFAAVFEFNPMSDASVERIRRWLSRPASGRVESEAFFGSFVSVFVNHRVGGAERVVRFRSQTVAVP